MSSDSYQTTILDVFLEYKQYYLDQITSKTLDKDSKMALMEDVISNLMEQNENLLETLLEVQQTAKDRSVQLHTLLNKIASSSNLIGSTLTSLELDIKHWSNSLESPSTLDCLDLISEITKHVDILEKENDGLQRQNQAFFDNLITQSSELMQYKQMVYSLMSKKPNTALLPQMIDNCENKDYLEVVLDRTLSEASETISTAVCANVLDEIISLVETKIESENNPDCLLTSKPIDLQSDINDNYEHDDPSSDRSFIECISPRESFYDERDLNSYQPQLLSLLSILCSELAFKTPVIHTMKRQLSHIKKEHLSLHNRHFQLATQILSTFVHLKEELEVKIESSQMKQRLIEELDSAMNHVLAIDSSAFALEATEAKA